LLVRNPRVKKSSKESRPKESIMDSGVACPACLDNRATELRRFSAEQSARFFTLREADADLELRLTSHLRALWGGDRCSIMVCQNCGFGFSWPYVAGDAAFYQLAFPNIGYTSDRWEFSRTQRELTRFDISGMELLEVGAGFGMFLDQLSSAGFPKSAITAIEHHPTSYARLQAKGYRASAHDVRSAEFTPARRFDLVCMFQVVEHMDRLDQLMDRLDLICSERAHIFLSVPNAQRTNYFEDHGWKFDMPPDHIGRWTRAAMEHLVARHGFRIESSDQESFGGLKFVRSDLASSYFRRVQEPGTLAHRIASMRRSQARRWLELATIVSYAPRRMGQWLRAYRYEGELGAALWFHLMRKNRAAEH
jgi:hypothetical protein